MSGRAMRRDPPLFDSRRRRPVRYKLVLRVHTGTIIYFHFQLDRRGTMASSSGPINNYGNYPLKDILAPHPHDVLCGRGGGTNNHIGNSHWRMLVAANKQLYITLPKRQKMLLSRSIVNAVRSQNPPGRFLQKDSKSNKWFDVGDQRAQEKTSQALREGAPDIRKKVAAHGETDAEGNPVESTEESSSTSADGEQAENSSSEKKIKTNNNTSQTPPPTPATSKVISKSPEASSTKPIPATPNNPSPIPAHMGNPSASPPQMMNNHPYGVMAGGYGMMPRGMPQLFAPGMGAPQGMMLFAGPNMQPVQVFPTMVMNEHGMMVPGMSMVPAAAAAMMTHLPQPQMAAGAAANSNAIPTMMPPPQLEVSAAGSAATQPASNIHEHHETDGNYHHEQQQQQQQQHNQQQQHYYHQQQHITNDNANNSAQTPTFDEFVAAPPDGLDGGCSFGSAAAMMTDADMMKLQATGASYGSVMSYKYGNNSHSNHHSQQQQQQQYHQQQQQQQQSYGMKREDHDDHTPIAFNSLEPTGISFGDMSMMSTGAKLEAGGTSFGTMMSLEQIGTSFGSLSLDPNSREMLYQTLELTGGGPQIPPMFDSEDKATGNLLECSDTESEDSQSKPELTAQKSEAWERMRMSVAYTQLQQSQSKGTVNSTDLMPPPTIMHSMNGEEGDMNGRVLSIPTTNFQRDYSQLSAWGDDGDDEAAAPPPQLEKQGSEGAEALVGYLSQQQS